MAFTINTWQAASPSNYGINTEWIYTTADSMATVLGSNYFLSLAVAGIQVDDSIYIVAADEANWFQFTTVSTTSVVIARASMLGTLALGNIWKGNASGLAAPFAPGTSAQIIQSTGTDLQWSTVSGNIAIALGGVATIQTNAISTAMLQNNVVIADKMASNSVTTDKILDANVTTAKILDANVTTAKIADGNVTLAKLSATATYVARTVYSAFVANGGGSATIVMAIPGVLGTDRAFVQVYASTNSVSVYKVTTASDEVSVLLSADPGAATTLSVHVERDAS